MLWETDLYGIFIWKVVKAVSCQGSLHFCMVPFAFYDWIWLCQMWHQSTNSSHCTVESHNTNVPFLTSPPLTFDLQLVVNCMIISADKPWLINLIKIHHYLCFFFQQGLVRTCGIKFTAAIILVYCLQVVLESTWLLPMLSSFMTLTLTHIMISKLRTVATELDRISELWSSAVNI